MESNQSKIKTGDTLYGRDIVCFFVVSYSYNTISIKSKSHHSGQSHAEQSEPSSLEMS